MSTPTHLRLLALSGPDALADAFAARARGAWGPRPGNSEWGWSAAVLDAVSLGRDRADVRQAVLDLFDRLRRTAATGPDPLAPVVLSCLRLVPWAPEIADGLAGDLVGLVRRMGQDPGAWGGLAPTDPALLPAVVEAGRSLLALGGPAAAADLVRLVQALRPTNPLLDLPQAEALGRLVGLCQTLPDAHTRRQAWSVLLSLSAAPAAEGLPAPREAALAAADSEAVHRAVPAEQLAAELQAADADWTQLGWARRRAAQVAPGSVRAAPRPHRIARPRSLQLAHDRIR